MKLNVNTCWAWDLGVKAVLSFFTEGDGMLWCAVAHGVEGGALGGFNGVTQRFCSSSLLSLYASSALWMIESAKFVLAIGSSALHDSVGLGMARDPA